MGVNINLALIKETKAFFLSMGFKIHNISWHVGTYAGARVKRIQYGSR